MNGSQAAAVQDNTEYRPLRVNIADQDVLGRYMMWSVMREDVCGCVMYRRHDSDGGVKCRFQVYGR